MGYNAILKGEGMKKLPIVIVLVLTMSSMLMGCTDEKPSKSELQEYFIVPHHEHFEFLTEEIRISDGEVYKIPIFLESNTSYLSIIVNYIDDIPEFFKDYVEITVVPPSNFQNPDNQPLTGLYSLKDTAGWLELTMFPHNLSHFYEAETGEDAVGLFLQNINLENAEGDWIIEIIYNEAGVVKSILGKELSVRIYYDQIIDIGFLEYNGEQLEIS